MDQPLHQAPCSIPVSDTIEKANPLALTGVGPLPRALMNAVSQLPVLRRWYDDWLATESQASQQTDTNTAARFLDYSLAKLDVSLAVNNPERAEQVPDQGPCLVVANHPLGAIEGMLLSQWLLTLRPDLKVLVNQVLLSLPEFRSLFIGVDVLNQNQQRRNARGLREADRHLARGGALLMFPAGTVARLNPRTGEIDEAPCQNSMSRLADFKVAEQGDFSVYLAPYDQLSDVADLLAVERERCFRAAGEGTGQSRDRDRFDPHYWHIWGWDNANQRIIGGYRLARVSDVLTKVGLEGLYSHSLFDYDNAFIATLGSSVEVGRSFVTEDYQRHPRALDLLWRGIGAFVNQQPQGHTLFGCVSISGRFVPVARALLADSLLANHRADIRLYSLIRPRAPLQFKRRLWTDDLLATLTQASAVNALLDHCPMERKIPTLIRHYLNLNGKFLSSTVNHGFSQSLDGLIMVDLRHTPGRYLKRYLGRTGADRFRALHLLAPNRENQENQYVA